MSIPRGLFLATDNEVVMAQAELVSDIQKLKATVARTGFEFESISVGMDLIPSISLGLSFNRMITDQERAQLNAEMQGDKFNILERALIDALLDAASVKIGGDGDNLVLSGADVDVDLIPSVTLTFEDDAPATVKN